MAGQTSPPAAGRVPGDDPPAPEAASGGFQLDRMVWTAVVLVFLAMALATPIVMAQAQRQGEGSEEATAGGGGPAEAKVTMAGLAFSPASLAVRPGATVVFQNDDVAPHTVTATSGSIDSGVINPGRQFSLVVRAPLEYSCSIHPAMKAKVVFSG